ncbi:hypothetical protein [Nonomuraea salmonea]|uniref:hypothetical protein n=1 Tax=Nonomuraea salmonea TaxID=46181 RepID=UPI0031EA98FB
MSRSRSKGWLGTLPLLAFFALVFGVPAIALVAGGPSRRRDGRAWPTSHRACRAATSPP